MPGGHDPDRRPRVPRGDKERELSGLRATAGGLGALDGLADEAAGGRVQHVGDAAVAPDVQMQHRLTD